MKYMKYGQSPSEFAAWVKITASHLDATWRAIADTEMMELIRYLCDRAAEPDIVIEARRDVQTSSPVLLPSIEPRSPGVFPPSAVPPQCS